MGRTSDDESESAPVAPAGTTAAPLDAGEPDESTTVDIVDSLGSVEFYADEAVYRASYDPRRDATSLAVVATVAAADGSDPLEAAPLHAVVDADALDALFTSSAEAGRGSAGVSFRYQGFDVAVFSEGVIEVAPSAPDRDR